MSDTLYNRIDYKLDNLLMDIESGKLGLPDLQRPFVWKNTKVRELFDSMLLGYPIGYLMPVVPNATPTWALVYIYADLDGNAEITNVYELYIDRHSTPAD